MKIFVFEYITGGGLVDQVLPDALCREGELMFTSLVRDLLSIKEVDVLVTRDPRLPAPECLNQDGIITINQAADLNRLLIKMIDSSDAVWLIAPETGRVLADLCDLVEQRGKPLLTSPSNAVLITGNKLATARLLERFQIPVVSTVLCSEAGPFEQGDWVLKPIDGVGCEDCCMISSEDDYQRYKAANDTLSNIVLQPYVKGQSISLSCLFDHGRANLLCSNEQIVDIVDNRFQLSACVVNSDQAHRQEYQSLIETIAEALPELWGYVGIDLIKTASSVVVLEINPRLTTSYVGIKAATGINVAEQVLALLKGTFQPLKPLLNVRVEVAIAEGEGYAR